LPRPLTRARNDNIVVFFVIARAICTAMTCSENDSEVRVLLPECRMDSGFFAVYVLTGGLQ